MRNEYEIRGDLAVILINSPKYGRKEALISTNKLERALEFTGSWCVSWIPRAKSLYVQGAIFNGIRKTVLLHRWITDAPDGMEVDHFNNDTLNNTDDNLRICTNAENQQNRKGANSDNKSSGIRGVSWDIMSGKWKSRMRLNNKLIHIGYFDELADAERAVKEAREKYMPFSKEAS